MMNFEKTLKTSSAWSIGLLQSAGVVLYIFLFAFFVTNMPHIDSLLPWLQISIMLTAFVLSALICSSLVLLYPALLVYKGQTKKGLTILLWSGVWLLIILASLAVVSIPYASSIKTD